MKEKEMFMETLERSLTNTIVYGVDSGLLKTVQETLSVPVSSALHYSKLLNLL